MAVVTLRGVDAGPAGRPWRWGSAASPRTGPRWWPGIPAGPAAGGKNPVPAPASQHRGGRGGQQSAQRGGLRR